MEHFGVQKEKKDRLEKVKGPLEDSFKLYIATIFVMVILTVIRIIKIILSKNYIETKMLLVILLQFKDLIAISVTQREKWLHLMCHKMNTNPAESNA